MLAHGVSEDIVASFAVKEKKAELPQWMVDSKTPVKRPKLPLPGFYRSPDELKPQACIDEWARVSQASMGSTVGVLTDVLSPAGLSTLRRISLAASSERRPRAPSGNEKKSWSLIHLYRRAPSSHDDWEGGVARRRNKPPNETFKRRSTISHYCKNGGWTPPHGSASGEYARLLLELTGNADAALHARKLERERERRLQALIVRVKRRMPRSTSKRLWSI